MPKEPYVYEITLDMCSVDFTGHWQPGAVFRAMQEAADGHCHVLDLTFERLRELGIAWVLSRAHLHMDDYPTLGQRVTVRTWPGKTKHMFFPRYFTFEAEGKMLGCASTLFVLMDLSERKIAPATRLGKPMPEYDIPAPLPFPGNLRAVEGAVSRHDYLPVYTDLDMNQHVNNTRYVDWFMNQFPMEKHQRQMLSDLLVHYNAEVIPGEKLTMEICEAGEMSVLRGLHGEPVCFAVEGTWHSRP
ncbi:MAG: thioesterase [Clostridiales bacterium]|nr:thioesterase [Clostridiales bacterium]